MSNLASTRIWWYSRHSYSFGSYPLFYDTTNRQHLQPHRNE